MRNAGVGWRRAGLNGLVSLRRTVKGSDTTIEYAGYYGVPNPEIRYSDHHLAAAEANSLGLSFYD